MTTKNPGRVERLGQERGSAGRPTTKQTKPGRSPYNPKKK